MSQINPFTGAVIQSTQVQRTQSADRDRQIQRAQHRSKNAAQAGDHFEHQVESADALVQIHDDPQHRRQNRKSPGEGDDPDPPRSEESADEPPRLDLTA